MRSGITFDELLGEMKRRPGGEGMTAREIADQAGVSRGAVYEMLRAAIAAGRVRTTRVRRVDLCGRTQDSPGYAIAKGKK